MHLNKLWDPEQPDVQGHGAVFGLSQELRIEQPWLAKQDYFVGAFE